MAILRYKTPSHEDDRGTYTTFINSDGALLSVAHELLDYPETIDGPDSMQLSLVPASIGTTLAKDNAFIILEDNRYRDQTPTMNENTFATRTT